MINRDDTTLPEIRASYNARRQVASALLDATKGNYKVTKQLPWVYSEDIEAFQLQLPHAGGTALYRLSRETRGCTGGCACACSCRCVTNEKIVLYADVPGLEPFESICCSTGNSSAHWLWKVLYAKLRVKELTEVLGPVEAFLRAHTRPEYVGR